VLRLQRRRLRLLQTRDVGVAPQRLRERELGRVAVVAVIHRRRIVDPRVIAAVIGVGTGAGTDLGQERAERLVGAGFGCLHICLGAEVARLAAAGALEEEG